MMDQREAERQAEREGLCGRCVHGTWIQNDRGSRFMRCGQSDTDPRFPRFPVLPVLACAGFEPRDDGPE